MTSDALRDLLAAALDGDPSVETGEDGLRVRLPDRTLVVERHDDGSQFALAVVADGETVSKFGLFDSPAALCERAAALQNGRVGYTVCCDG